MNELTYEDYNFLIEALDAKLSGITSSAMVGGMLSMMLSKNKDDAEDQLTEALDEATEKKKAIEEKVIMMKAKLITLRDQLMVKNLEGEITNE